jgi:signal transduction histidine kinase
LTVATAADLNERDPAATGRLLAKLQGTLQSAVGDIRAMVEELRPPALDELGLVHALQDRSSELAPAIVVDVVGPDKLPLLPAAVEVAAYRICQEALMNVLKHSGARYARVTIAVEDGLTLVIEDDGVGLVHRGTRGVGLASMRERAAELGGRCTVDESASGGTRVSVLLPVGISSEDIA